MKRRILAGVCAVMLLVSGTACSNSGGKDPSAENMQFMVSYFD